MDPYGYNGYNPYQSNYSSYCNQASQPKPKISQRQWASLGVTSAADNNAIIRLQQIMKERSEQK